MQNRQNSWSPPVFARKHASSMQASSTTLENIVVIMRQVVEAPAVSSIEKAQDRSSAQKNLVVVARRLPTTRVGNTLWWSVRVR